MLSIFKKLFGKPAPKAVRAVPAQQQPLEPSVAMPTVEVAHLSLAVIVDHLPADIKALVTQTPAAGATVALPVPTIMKQLGTGCVKMSASLHRQAHGVFAPLPAGDKRTVDVPLVEIFRHISPQNLKRRPDQRAVYLPVNGFNLFGNAENPYEISPTAPEDEPPADSMVLDLTPDLPQGLKMSEEVEEPANGNKPHANPPPPVSRSAGIQPPPGLTARAKVESSAEDDAPEAAAQTTESPTAEEGPSISLPLAPIADTWPEDIRAALGSAIEAGASLALPSARLSEGLAKGRVAFTWGQICGLLTSGAISPGSIDESTSLLIPLRIVAPAFLSATKQAKAPRKGVFLDASIPAPFSGGRPFTPAAHAPAPSAPLPEPSEPAVEPSAPLPAPKMEEAPISHADGDAAPEARDEHIHISGEVAPEAAPAVEFKLAPSPELEFSPTPVHTEPAPVHAEHGKLPETIGEIFGEPHKLDWTPAEIVHHTVKLPGVSGAVVALQEGLQVASSLPDGVKSDVVAAFLPQIFARLNQYAGEMRLGDVDDLLFTTHGAHCQIYRLGYVYFAVLGKPGESLPWHELRLVSEELARQTNK